ncbi:MAG: hypothetical protein N5P05_002325 [Chroococcopsis gigantea SAG 12.99]|jgi:hypothetical protein|nr:hypothetical protein [Chlorogloea purpurea SAG 13.99]MDV3000719.1 hypothetical protein [Chroococcopsis gigantea SAG 12.99]
MDRYERTAQKLGYDAQYWREMDELEQNYELRREDYPYLNDDEFYELSDIPAVPEHELLRLLREFEARQPRNGGMPGDG